MNNNEIIIKGLYENNLKNVNLNLSKHKIIVFTGVSGSGKSSIVFDTIAAESQRQMNESYSAFIRGRLPKYTKPHVELIDNLSASVIVDQSPLGGNSRSTVGTISDMYTSLRLLFSRIGTPYVGTSSYFSFNDPNGMCPTCSGIGKVTKVDIESFLDYDKSLNEGCISFTLYNPESYYWSQLQRSGFFDMNKKLKDYSDEEKNLLLTGNKNGFTVEQLQKRDDITPNEAKKLLRESKFVEGLLPHITRLFLNRDTSVMSKASQEHQKNVLIEDTCPDCHGERLNEKARNCKVAGYTIVEMCNMEFVDLRNILMTITDSRVSSVVEFLCTSLTRLIEIGLPYLHMNRESSSLSGGEAQRLKLVRFMGSSLTDLIYIFDEPSTGLHPRDVGRMNALLQNLRNKGNTVLVVEHDKDVISIADEVVDVGPKAGQHGGEIVFQGTYANLLNSDTLTGKALNYTLQYKTTVRTAKTWLPIKNANIHNLKNVSVNIPEGIMTVITGVAGSGKSSLISNCFAKTYEDRVIKIDQGPITATNRSMPASYIGFFDDIRKLFAKETGKDAGFFSFNSKGACPMCQGKGFIVTELVFMDPVTTPCEACGTKRFNNESLALTYKGKNIVEILEMTVETSIEFFKGTKIEKPLLALQRVGLSYMTLGQPLSTLSGGERQRIKLAKYIDQKGNIFILDEPTTGLHCSDIENLLVLFEDLVAKGNTVLIIEHNLDVVKRADWVIDIGPDGGKNGGTVVFEGTPKTMRDNSDTITAQCLRKS